MILPHSLIPFITAIQFCLGKIHFPTPFSFVASSFQFLHPHRLFLFFKDGVTFWPATVLEAASSGCRWESAKCCANKCAHSQEAKHLTAFRQSAGLEYACFGPGSVHFILGHIFVFIQVALDIIKDVQGPTIKNYRNSSFIFAIQDCAAVKCINRILW